MSRIVLAVLGLSVASTAFADNTVVDQINKSFSQDRLVVKVGDTVEFRNSDPFFHNVFSLSDAKFFDLGSYPKGESKTVEFDQPGVVQVECSIHPEMQMEIEVQE